MSSDPPRNLSSATSGTRQSRLQSRAPSSIQINRVVEWNVAIPLLSPLASSPPPQQLDLKPQDASKRHHGGGDAAKEKTTTTAAMSFKMWQHPAAPFCYEPAPVVPPFVPV